LRDELKAKVRDILLRRRPAEYEYRGLRALHDVSFEVEEGDSLALIGPNGSGKTSALKLLCRITYPTSGRIAVRGTIGALIEVGSSVHPELTGRENIWLAGQILGMSKPDVRRRFDEIVEFAELGHVLDTQAKMYSSGMQLRLGFSIAAHLEPDVFVVDEALAVGDAAFQARCVERMTKLVTSGTTLIFVSHDLAAAERLCRRGVFLLDGEVQLAGATGDVVHSYLDWVDRAHQARLTERFEPNPSEILSLVKARCFDDRNEERYAYRTGEDVDLQLGFRSTRPVRRPQVNIGITDGRPGALVLCSMPADGTTPKHIEGPFTVSLRLRGVPLLPRVYQLWCSVREEYGTAELFEWQPVGVFRIEESEGRPRAVTGTGTATDGPIFVPHEWRLGDGDNG
jgi:ABC-type polysaccharide/polyol phosphate transport system ATPase subunit